MEPKVPPGVGSETNVCRFSDHFFVHNFQKMVNIQMPGAFLKEFGRKQWTKRCMQEFPSALLVFRMAIMASQDCRDPLSDNLEYHGYQNVLFQSQGFVLLYSG
jgi:hypothetical protein